MTPKPKYLLGGIIGVALILIAILVLGPRLRPYSFHGIVLQANQEPRDFTLTAHTGDRVHLSDFQGKTVILYYGYTFCPDVCPLTLADLAQAVRLLEDKADQVQVLFVTIDPERDTAERLSQYVPAFHPDFIGLTGTDEEIAAAATPLGIYYGKSDVEGASGYLMDHTATVSVLDESGSMRLMWPFGTPAEDMAEDLAYLLR